MEENQKKSLEQLPIFTSTSTKNLDDVLALELLFRLFSPKNAPF